MATNSGFLTVSVTAGNRPVENAIVQVLDGTDATTLIAEARTNSSGQAEYIELATPPLEYSMTPSSERPYAVYTIRIQAPGFEKYEISGAEIFPDEEAIQNVPLIPQTAAGPESSELFVIPPHTLWGDYPPKIAEDELKEVQNSGEIVLSRVVIPEFVIVHDGPPTDRSAKNYYVPFKDYIKNVASSEIYSTWPEATLQANILAIQSFTLNRVYTEWYRNRGYDFTITSSTAFDQKWIPGRNIFQRISSVVDELFNNYLTRPDIIQPLLTQYCDGRKATCPNSMSQWGSKALGDEGYSAIEILRTYYGNSITIDSSEIISGVPSSYPGYLLRVGSTGEKVRQMQQQLNEIANAYPLIPKIAADGIFGSQTENSVRIFQSIFRLTQDGIVGFKTWYKISEIYVAVSRIAQGTNERK